MELKINLSKELRKSFEKAVKSIKHVPESVKKCLKEGGRVGLEEIRWLHENHQNGVWLHELLAGAELCLPEPYIPPRNPELEARCQKLRAQAAQQEYQQMTRNVDSTRVRHPEDTIKFQLDMINRQLIAVFQFVVSVIAGFAFGFYGIELLVGDLDFGFRLLLGVMFSLIIALAEIYFLAKKLANDLDFPDLDKQMKVD